MPKKRKLSGSFEEASLISCLSKARRSLQEMENDISILVDTNAESCSETMGAVIDDKIELYYKLYDNFEKLLFETQAIRIQKKLNIKK